MDTIAVNGTEFYVPDGMKWVWNTTDDGGEWVVLDKYGNWTLKGLTMEQASAFLQSFWVNPLGED